MSNQTFTVTDKQKDQLIQLQAISLHVHAPFKVLKCIDNNQSSHYVFFYKNDFLTSQEITEIDQKSSLARTLKIGFSFLSPHPLITSLLSSQKSMPLRSVNKLIKFVESTYSPQETAFILTYLDHIVPKEKLTNWIKEIYFQYRRNGQFKTAYQFIRILTTSDPTNIWVKEISSHLEYQKFQQDYNLPIKDLIRLDPLYVENRCFSLKNKSYFPILKSLFEKEKRVNDLTMLYIKQLTLHKLDDHFSDFQIHLNENYSPDETVYIMKDLHDKNPNYTKLQRALFNILINLNRQDEAINLLINTTLPIDSAYQDEIKEVFETTSLTKLPLEKLNTIIIPLFQSDSNKLEHILRQCVSQLLRNHEISYINDWLKPIKDYPLSLPIVETIQLMTDIFDEPNEQMQLGELYYQLKQLDKAIDCFSWEMELKPTDPNPVQWLSKTYKQKGLIDEMKAYEHLYKSMNA